MRQFVPLSLGLLLALPAVAQKPAARAFVGAHLIPIAGPEIPDGTLVVRGGVITAIGKRGEVPVPEDAEVVDGKDKVIMPGLVCTHSHVGGPSGADRSAPIQPECRAYDAVNVRDAGFMKARSGGLTTLNIMPGSGHLLSGQTIYVKLRDGNSIDDIAYQWPDGTPMGGMKMANGTNSIRSAPFPGTRAKSAALMRAMLTKAKRYKEKLETRDDVERDLRLEGLVEVLSGKRIVHHHTHRHDDILTVLRIQKEFGFRVVLHHVSEAWKVADEIAAAKAPCSLILLDSPGGKLEAMDLSMRNGLELEKRGVNVAMHTDDGITDSRLFRRMAAFAVRAGMSREAALRSLTLAGAEMLDLQKRVGSLEVGKDADLAILDGDPFSVWSHVQETWVEGERVYDRSNPDHRLFAEGGRGASQPQTFNMCCFQAFGGGQ